MKESHHRRKIRQYLNEILLEEYNEQGSLIHKLKGEILELEYKGDEQTFIDIVEGLESRIGILEAEKITLQEDLAAKELKIQELEDRIIVLEPEPPE